jgi:Ni/Co efflux regulator RcnB
MNKLMISAAVLAVCLGAPAAFAQDTTQSTTTVQTPNGEKTTSTTESNDGYAQYRKTVTSTKHYNAGVYEAPAGYSYTRFTVGQRVPSALLGRHIDDYDDYALQAPPSGLTWIRVGGDALLVDSNGQVIQANYSLFTD